MPANNLPAPAVRAPRLQVLVNGSTAPHPIMAEIVSNNHYAADRFRVTLALNGGPAAPWANATDLAVEIQLSLDAGATWTSLLQGKVDTVDLAPLAGTVRLFGRDRTADLIEALTRETFANQTASDIALQLAARHNLTLELASTLFERLARIVTERTEVDDGIVEVGSRVHLGDGDHPEPLIGIGKSLDLLCDDLAEHLVDPASSGIAGCAAIGAVARTVCHQLS